MNATTRRTHQDLANLRHIIVVAIDCHPFIYMTQTGVISRKEILLRDNWDTKCVAAFLQYTKITTKTFIGCNLDKLILHKLKLAWVETIVRFQAQESVIGLDTYCIVY